MKKVLWVILLVGVIGCFLWLALFDMNAASRHMIAKVRYFDGSTDTIRISEYSPVGGSIRLKAEDGHIAVIGANNVIIVEDEEYWRDSLD